MYFIFRFPRTLDASLPTMNLKNALIINRWLACTLALALPPCAWSQEKAAQPEDEIVLLDTFVVSADTDKGYRASNSISGTRLNQKIEDIAQNISVITEDFLKDLQAMDMVEALGYTVSVTRDDVASESAFTLRGFNALRPLRNGVMTSGGVIPDMLGIGRIEIVKGPASVLYGVASPGGLINYVTKEPDDKKQFVSFRQTVGSWSFSRSEADINIPLVKNGKKGLFLRVLGAYTDNGGYIGNGYIRRFLAASLLWRPARGTEVSATLDRTVQNQERVGASIMNNKKTAFMDLPNDFNRAGTLDTDLTFVQVQLRQRLGYHWNARLSFTFHENRQYYAYFTAANNTTDNVSDTRVRYKFANNENRFPNYYGTLEAVGKYQFGRVQSTTLIGLEYITNTLHYRAANAPNSYSQTWIINDPSTWTFGQLADRSIYTDLNDNSSVRDQDFNGLYIDQQFEFFDGKLRLSMGARRDDYDIHYDYIHKTGDEKYTSFSADNVSPKFGVVWRPASALSFFVLYSESFIQNAYYDIDGKPLPPQTGKGWEGGVKLNFLSGRISGTISTYRILRQDVPQAIIGVFPTKYRLVGEEEAKGVETQMFFNPTSQLQIVASYAYNDARVSKDTNTAYVDTILQNAPRHTASLLTKYNWKKGALKGFSLGAGFRYKDSFYAFAPSTADIKVADSFFSDAFAGYGRRMGSAWCSINLKVSNLFDGTGGGFRNIPAAPRSYMLSTELKF
jgi:iron complex outermembrane receptor protein